MFKLLPNSFNCCLETYFELMFAFHVVADDRFPLIHCIVGSLLMIPCWCVFNKYICVSFLCASVFVQLYLCICICVFVHLYLYIDGTQLMIPLCWCGSTKWYLHSESSPSEINRAITPTIFWNQIHIIYLSANWQHWKIWQHINLDLIQM